MKNITIYTTNSCPYCDSLKSFLSEKSIQYTEKNVEEDADARAEMLNKTNALSVPVIDIDGEVIVGFNKHDIEKALA